MNIAVRYYTRSGNTKKIADAIAQAVGVEAKTDGAPLSEKTDVLFLGSSVYAGGVDTAVINFIKENKDNIGMVYNFSTAAFPMSTYKNVRKVCDELGIKMAAENFKCRGSFTVMNKNRPNEADLKEAAEFAKSAVGQQK